MTTSTRLYLGWGLLALGVFLGGWLMTGGSGMMKLVFGVPRGNFVAAGLLLAGPMALLAFPGGPPKLRRAALVSLVLALAWYPGSCLLAGNAALRFQNGTRFTLWLAYTAFILFSVAVMLALRSFQVMKARLEKAMAKGGKH